MAILPRAHPDGLHVLEITDPSTRSRLELVWHREGPPRPAARALIAHARAADLAL